MSGVLAFVPEELFKHGVIPCEWSESAILLVNRLLFFLLVFTIPNIIFFRYLKRRNSVILSDKTMVIKIEYGDIVKIKSGKKVINFDECFTTKVGSRPEEIRPNSVCGQYLAKHPISNMADLIKSAGIQPSGESRYNNTLSYTPGTLIPKDDYLLMAFAKLDERGLGRMAYDECLKCLDKLWEQIDLYHGTDDVYLPILGSRITRFDKDLTQQELLDVMIASYRLSPNKMTKPRVLHIVCRRRDDFSINDVFGVD